MPPQFKARGIASEVKLAKGRINANYLKNHRNRKSNQIILSQL